MSSSSAIHAKAIELAKHVVQMTTASGSGHPSTALALTHIVIELMYRQMRYDPSDPWHPTADRLVLSLGHAVPIVYAVYADLGGAVGTSRENKTMLRVDDLKTLREMSSVLDGHPNPTEGFPFFDAATGSLGQGLSVGAGLGLAARLDHSPRRVFVILGDGESREGQVWEAADFIVDYRLTNVCAIFSCNGWGQAGEVSAQQSAESITNKLLAFGWEVRRVDGHDPEALSKVFTFADDSKKPVAVVAKTIKGWGVPSIQKQNYHGKPVPPKDVPSVYAELDASGVQLHARSEPLAVPRVSAAFKSTSNVKSIHIAPFADALTRCDLSTALNTRKLSTRVAYGVGLVALGDADQRIVALDGDVSNSTFANLFAKRHSTRFFECKIAEQNMISAAAGMAAAGKIPFASSFAKFLARATDQIDMAAITRANIKIVGSHSGVSLAADGPSQMSLSDMAYFRSMTRVDVGQGIPACVVFHPSDAVSAYRCCELAANHRGMCFLRTHRPDAPFLYEMNEAFELRGCKQLRRGDHLTLVSSGYMLHTVLEAADRLKASGVACNVFDAYTFPMDASPILASARSGRHSVLTVEDNYVGGLHSEIAEAAAEFGDIRVAGLCARRMPKSGRTAEELFSYVGVGIEQVLERAQQLVGA
ncbi:MAG: transketolase [Planctomycetota bacterium]